MDAEGRWVVDCPVHQGCAWGTWFPAGWEQKEGVRAWETRGGGMTSWMKGPGGSALICWSLETEWHLAGKEEDWEEACLEEGAQPPRL